MFTRKAHSQMTCFLRASPVRQQSIRHPSLAEIALIWHQPRRLNLRAPSDGTIPGIRRLRNISVPFWLSPPVVGGG